MNQRIINTLGIFIFLCVKTDLTLASTWTQTPNTWAGSNDESAAAAAHHSAVKKSDIKTSGSPSPFTPGSNNISIDVGQVFLMGDLTRYNNTIGTELHYSYGVSELFTFDSSFGYSNFSSGKYSMITALTGVRLNLAWYDKLIPYISFGLGFYRPYYEDSTVPATQNQGGGSSPASVSAFLFGLHLGPGIDLEISKNLYFGASVTLHNMFGASQTWGNGTPVNVGGAFAAFLAHIGASF